MRHLQRYLRICLRACAVMTALTSVALFVKGIWTPQWHQVANSDGFVGCDGKDACYQYQANHQWLATGLVFLIMTAVLVVLRVVAWRMDEAAEHHH